VRTSNSKANIHIIPFQFIKNSYFKLLQGSVATLFRWSWKILSYFVANFSKTLHINFYQNRSSIVEVMIKKNLVHFFMPHSVYRLTCRFSEQAELLVSTSDGWKSVDISHFYLLAFNVPDYRQWWVWLVVAVVIIIFINISRDGVWQAQQTSMNVHWQQCTYVTLCIVQCCFHLLLSFLRNTHRTCPVLFCIFEV